MKSLIIHPDDDTTDFLKIVYQKIPNQTVITGGVFKEDLVELISSHD